jgi:hypothetical protein
MHQAHRLAVAFRVGHAEVAHAALVGALRAITTQRLEPGKALDRAIVAERPARSGVIFNAGKWENAVAPGRATCVFCQDVNLA